MAQCTQWYGAEDQSGSSMPSTVYADFQSWNGSFWESIGTISIPSSGAPTSNSLPEGERFRVAPMPKSGYITPDEIEFVACGYDVILVYKKVICTPDALKCIGDNVYKCNSDGTEWEFSKSCPGGCSGGECIEVTVGNGFTIHVATALSTKTILVAHVVKLPHFGLPGVDPGPDIYYWPQAFDYVGGEWWMVDPSTTYIAQVGSILETIPSFDKTHGTGSFADGIDCVVMAVGDSGVGTLLFKEEDVFRLNKDSPTEIWLSNTSNDIISEALMGPVCDLFGIDRGDQCKMFWAELFDPIFIANYTCIKNTGKDLLGNEREITLFDKIALPFAILGSLPGLSLLPFGAFVTAGLKTATKFGDTAVQFMLNFTMDAANMVSTKGTWYFLDAIGQVTKAHADEIIGALEAGDTTLADSLLRKYAGESKGWWDYHTLNDMLRDALPTDAYNWLRTQIGLKEIGAGTVTNVAKQVPPLSADDVAKLADAAKDSGVMDEVTEAVYKSLIDVQGASTTKVEELANILKNSPETSARIAAKNVPMARFVDSTTKHYDVIKNQLGATKANAWFKNNAGIAGKALDSPDPAKMADIPHAAQDVAANQGKLVEDYCGGHVEPCYSATSDKLFGAGKTAADDIVEQTEGFYFESHSLWKARAINYVNHKYGTAMNWFDNLSPKNQENAIHGMMAAALLFCVGILYKIYTHAGPESLNQNLFTSKMDTWYWPCYYACENKDAATLDEAIKVYETVINECAESLYDHKTVLEDDGLYDEFHRVLQLHQFNISRMKHCLEGLQPSGNIKCTSNEDFFYVDLDGQPAGFSYANREILLTAIKTGSHDVKIHKHGYTPECTESVNVTEGSTKTVDCQMTEPGGCSPITSVNIYLDPLSPVEDETVSFNGSAKSGNTISKWEWDFGDGVTTTGQAVTHTYSSKGIYTVKLLVTNDCGLSEFTTRNVTVSEETVVPESTTLQIEIPYGTDGKEIPRYWEVEIWVDGKDTACNPPKTLTFGTDVFCDCTSPWNLVECELGTHTITLKKYGYDDKSISVYLAKDTPKTWTKPIMSKVTTPPPMRTVYIEVPVGSMLYVDGGSVGGTSVSRLTAIYDGLRKR